MGCGASSQKLEEQSTSLAHFQVERILGKGAFGKVKAVVKKTKTDKVRKSFLFLSLMLLIHTHTHTHTQTRWGLSWNEDHYPRVMMDMYGPGRTWGTHCMLWIRTELPPLQIPMRARARVCVCV